MASFNKFNQFVQNLAQGVHNLNTDTCKVLLTNSAPASTNAVYTDITELGSGNGYTTGGATVTVVSCTQTSGVLAFKGSAASPTWTATGSMGPFRYVVIYDTTPVSPAKPLIGWWDFGTSLTLTSGNTFTVTFDATNGILQIS